MKKLDLSAPEKKSYSRDSMPVKETMSQASAGQEKSPEQPPVKDIKKLKMIYASIILLLSCVMIISELLRLGEIRQMIADNQSDLGRMIIYGPIAVSVMTFMISVILLFSSSIQSVIKWLVVPLVFSLFHGTFTNTFATPSVHMFFTTIELGYLVIRNIFAMVVCWHVFRKPTIPIIVYSLYVLYFVSGIFTLLNKTNMTIGIEYYTGYVREIAFTVLLIFGSLLVSLEPKRKRDEIYRLKR